MKYYIVICGMVWCYYIVFTSFHKNTTFGKHLLCIRYILWFCLQLLSATFLITRGIKQVIIIINVRWSSCKNIPYPFQIVIKIKFFRQMLEISSNIKFHENPSSNNRGFLCGQMVRQTDMTKLIVAFRNSGTRLEINKFFLGL